MNLKEKLNELKNWKTILKSRKKYDDPERILLIALFLILNQKEKCLLMKTTR